jgi:hypothetical protein
MDFSRFLQATRQGCVDAWAASVHWKDSPSPPPAPDYSGAAAATAAGNIDAARVATKANRVNQYTPYGSITYTPGQSGDPDLWRSDISLSPTGQKLLDYSNTAALGLGQETGQALDRVSQGLAQPFDYGGVGDVSDAAYAAQTSRLDPQWNEREQQQRTILANQGLAAGGEAYDSAMRNFNQGRNDAYTQARMAAINTMPQSYQLAAALRSQPLNELNALRTGSQVQNPQFTPVPQQATTPGANYLGAAQAQGQSGMQQYHADVAAQNALTGGLFQLGGAVLGSPWAGKAMGF